MFGHYCPSCQYAEFTPNVLMSGKTLDKTQRLESMRIVELAQYSRDELMCHPLYMDSLMGEDKQERLFFMLSAPCKSPYLELTLKDGKFYAMKDWDKVPGELQEKRTPSSFECAHSAFTTSLRGRIMKPMPCISLFSLTWVDS